MAEEKEDPRKELIAEAIEVLMGEDPSCDCERCQVRRDWVKRAKEEIDHA